MKLCPTCDSYDISLNNTNCTMTINDVIVVFSITLRHIDSLMTLCPLLEDNSPYNITLFEFNVTRVAVQFDTAIMCSTSSPTLSYSINHLLIIAGSSFGGACLVMTACSCILLMIRFKIKSLRDNERANKKKWYSCLFIALIFTLFLLGKMTILF